MTLTSGRPRLGRGRIHSWTAHVKRVKRNVCFVAHSGVNLFLVLSVLSVFVVLPFGWRQRVVWMKKVAMKRVCFASAIALVIGSVGESVAQTRLHRDWGGVTQRSGNVTLRVRINGPVLTSIHVGRASYHSGDNGITGFSYYYDTGRLDTLSNPRRQRSRSWYTPYHFRPKYYGHYPKLKRAWNPSGFAPVTARRTAHHVPRRYTGGVSRLPW